MPQEVRTHFTEFALDHINTLSEFFLKFDYNFLIVINDGDHTGSVEYINPAGERSRVLFAVTDNGVSIYEWTNCWASHDSELEKLLRRDR